MKKELDNIPFNFTEVDFKSTVVTSKTRQHQIKMKTLVSGNSLIWLKTVEGGVHLTQKRFHESIGPGYKVTPEEKLYHCYVNDDPDEIKDLVVLLNDSTIAAMSNIPTSYIIEWQPYVKGVDPKWEGHQFNV